MTRLAAAILRALNHHRRPTLAQRRAAATARTGHWPITDTQLAQQLARWADEQKENQ